MEMTAQTPGGMTPAVSEQVKPKQKKKGRKRKLVKRIILIVMLLIVLAIAGFIVYGKLKTEYTVTYDPYTATVGSISNSLSYSGTMQLKNNTTYTASAALKVREVYVAAGDKVAEGDKLIRFTNGDTVTADFGGTVNRVDVEKGDEVRSGANLVQVADFDAMQVSFRVSESDITDVHAGQNVRVSVSSIGASFESTIKSIDYASYSGNNVAYYTAVVDVDTSRVDNIYPGMQATITIPQEEANNVVILKMDALSTARDNTAFVFKQKEDGSMEQTEVTVGVSNGNYVEIKSGVSEGETVYAIAETEDVTSGLLAGLFGGQQVNMPSGGTGNFGGGNGNTERRNWNNEGGGGNNAPGSGGGRGN